MKVSNKKRESKSFRNKHSKDMRRLLKNKRIKVNAKSICLS